MPPKKAKAAPKPTLTNCSITFGATSIPKDALGGQSLADAKSEISKHCGSYVTKVQECTHLVLTDSQYSKGSKKIEDAKATRDVHIVSYEWLEKSFTSGTPVSESSYLFKDQSKKPPTNVATSNGSTKTAKSSTSKKRKRKAESDVDDDEEDDEEDDDAPETKRTHGNGKEINVTKKLDMKIPLDDTFAKYYGPGYSVYIGDDSAIYDVTLNQSDSGANANKFYRMQLLKDLNGKGWSLWTRWGRVGEEGQTKLVCTSVDFEQASKEFEKKFKDKTGNTWEERATGPMRPKKYVFVERSYEDSDSEGEDELPGAEKRKKFNNEDVIEEEAEEIIESKLPEPTQRLLQLIFNLNNFNATLDSLDYDAEKMPLGKLSKSSLLRGYEVLKTLASLITSPSDGHQVRILSNQYLSLIPHVIKRNQSPPVLNTMDKVKKELEVLEALTDMQLANDLMKGAKKSKEKAEEVNLLDRQFQGLGMQEMTPIDRISTEFKELENYLVNSVGHTHGTRYHVQDIFRIERTGETTRFDNSKYSKISNKNRKLLWHGSRTTNFGGILSQGLRIAPPEAPVSGYMFGKGVYLADMSSKSANYCCAYNSGGTGLLLLCEAELGEPPLKLTDGDFNAGDRAKAENRLSTLGVGQTAPQAWKDAGCVHPDLKGIKMPDVVSKPCDTTNEPGAYLQYNEYIVYDVAQIKLRYLFRVQM